MNLALTALTAISASLLCLAFGARAQAQTPAQTPADNCEGIKQQIADRYRAGGVPDPALLVVAASSPPNGRVVGRCGNGNKRIVFVGTRPTTPATAPAAPAAPAAAPTPATPPDRIPTECKDGSIVIGPDCDDPRAPRMTSADLAASVELAASAPAAASAPTSAPASSAPR